MWGRQRKDWMTMLIAKFCSFDWVRGNGAEIVIETEGRCGGRGIWAHLLFPLTALHVCVLFRFCFSLPLCLIKLVVRLSKIYKVIHSCGYVQRIVSSRQLWQQPVSRFDGISSRRGYGAGHIDSKRGMEMEISRLQHTTKCPASSQTSSLSSSSRQPKEIVGFWYANRQNDDVFETWLRFIDGWSWQKRKVNQCDKTKLKMKWERVM